MNHEHCCHRIRAWFKEQYCQKRNRSPYRQKSFENTLRSYAPPAKNVFKSRNQSLLSIKSKLFSENDNTQNICTEQIISSPIDVKSIKQQSPTKDKIVFKQILGSNQSDNSHNIMFPYTSQFERIDIYSYQPNIPSLAQTCLLSKQEQKENIEEKENNNNQNLSLCEPISNEILEQLFASSVAIKRKSNSRKFSVRIIKKQFKELWSKDKLSELCEAIISTRKLVEDSGKEAMKAKLYSLLLSQFI